MTVDGQPEDPRKMRLVRLDVSRTSEETVVITVEASNGEPPLVSILESLKLPPVGGYARIEKSWPA